jgi:MATE family multidrug resistance protein
VLLPLSKPLFHWLFVEISPPTEDTVMAPEVVASQTAVVASILALGLTGHMISQACSYYLEALRRPLLVTVVMYAGVAMNLVLNILFVAGAYGMRRWAPRAWPGPPP